jgi:hypothetical protein
VAPPSIAIVYSLQSTVCIVYSEALTLYSVRGYNEEKGSRSYVTG